MTWAALVPELSVRDLEASLAFYLRAGFEVRFRRTDPSFVYLDLGAAQLMLEEIHPGGWETGPLEPPLGRGMNLQIEVPDVDALVARLGVPLFRDIRDEWYDVGDGTEEGQREVLIQDPDGYLLRFLTPLGTRAATFRVEHS